MALRRLEGRPTLRAGAYDLATLGYAEREYVLDGLARSYRLAGTRTQDGRWDATPDVEAPFATRLVVREPADPADASGTVVVEWLNVTGGSDLAPEWILLHRHLLRRGHAWVGVSAQRAGVEGGAATPGMHLKRASPRRYAGLHHPGDAWSYDIFTQATRAVRGGDVLASGVPGCVLAVGESQSAAYLVTYLNGVDGDAQAVDGCLVHGRGAAAAGLDGTYSARLGRALGPGRDRAPDGTAPAEAIRGDVRVPVVVLQSETDVALLGAGRLDQPDGDRLRVWEVAGAAHGDTYLVFAGPADDGRRPVAELAARLAPADRVLGVRADPPINSAPQQHYVGQAALDHLRRWARGGAPPPRADRLVLDPARADVAPDDLGLARGGVRTPWVDVPDRITSGLGQRGRGIVALYGTTTALDAETFARRYPGGARDYLARFTAALDGTIDAGFLLADDRDEIVALAAASLTAGAG